MVPDVGVNEEPTDDCLYRTAIGAYLLGALAPSARLEVAAHLRDCQLCRDEVVLLAELPGLLARVRKGPTGR